MSRPRQRVALPPGRESAPRDGKSVARTETVALSRPAPWDRARQTSNPSSHDAVAPPARRLGEHPQARRQYLHHRHCQDPRHGDGRRTGCGRVLSLLEELSPLWQPPRHWLGRALGSRWLWRRSPARRQCRDQPRPPAFWPVERPEWSCRPGRTWSRARDRAPPGSWRRHAKARSRNRLAEQLREECSSSGAHRRSFSCDGRCARRARHLRRPPAPGCRPRRCRRRRTLVPRRSRPRRSAWR